MANSNVFFDAMDRNQMTDRFIENRPVLAGEQMPWQPNYRTQSAGHLLGDNVAFDGVDTVNGFRRGTNLPPYYVTPRSVRRGFETTGAGSEFAPNTNVNLPARGYVYGQTFVPVQEHVEAPVEWIYGAPRYDVAYYDEIITDENGSTYVETKAMPFEVTADGQRRYIKPSTVATKSMPLPLTNNTVAKSTNYRGVGPQGYQRSPQSIQDDICRFITDHPGIDASDTEVKVKGDGIVELKGRVDSRLTKRLIEDCCDRVRGVQDVHNDLKIDPNFWNDKSTKGNNRG